MEKAYKFRIYPTKDQQTLIQKTFGCCRFVYNRYLAMRIEKYKESKAALGYYECSADLTKLKTELDWLKAVDSTALQSSLKDLDTAYKNFFRRVKNGEKPGFPKFKSKKQNHQSYKTKMNIKVFEDTIKLPKLGFVSARISQQVQGRILNATVSQNPSGKYFVSICCTDVEIPQYEISDKAIGIDMGLTKFCINSDGEPFENHKYLAKNQKKLAKLQRQLSRKSKGSNNRNKARIKMARLYEKITNQRNDTLHKLSTQFVKDYDVICVEDLQVKNMVRNHKLAKSINDVSWSEFTRMLKYKCEWQHKALVKIDKFFPSSQLCSCCGTKNPITKDLKVRHWICIDCGAAHERDINAAKNILNEGLRLLNIA
ncbi:putative transposase [Popillia japonica]|uniref:Transposase n=1 Tax=Popillia japonica TaxID=7064 RepID=A0AAW1HFJ5_POPJA